MVCPHGQGGLSQCGHFVDKEGVIFCDFVRTFFIDGPLLNLDNACLCVCLFCYVVYMHYAHYTVAHHNLLKYQPSRKRRMYQRNKCCNKRAAYNKVL